MYHMLSNVSAKCQLFIMSPMSSKELTMSLIYIKELTLLSIMLSEIIQLLQTMLELNFTMLPLLLQLLVAVAGDAAVAPFMSEAMPGSLPRSDALQREGTRNARHQV